MKFADMPLRDYYALEIIKGIVARGEAHSTTQVAQAYDVADALLKFQNRELTEHAHEIAALTARAERAETQASLLLNMNEDGQFAPRAALTQIWERLGVDNQTAAMQELESLYVDRSGEARS